MPHLHLPDGDAPPEVRLWQLRPEMGAAAGRLSHAIYEQSIVPVRERELARMRIALINECAICRAWRSTPGAHTALGEDDYANVLQWRDYAGYGERDRLAIELAERFALAHTTIDGPFFDRLRAAGFSEPEILDLTVCIAGWLALGRTLHVLGVDDACRIP